MISNLINVLFAAAVTLVIMLSIAAIIAGPRATYHALAVISRGGPLWLVINTQCQDRQEEPMTIAEWCDR